MRCNDACFGILRLGIAAGFALQAPAALAHHTFAAEYEGQEMITLEAVVKEVWFNNPHVRIDIIVTSSDGQQQIWAANTVSPRAVSHRGWGPDTVMPGARITVYGNLGRDGAKRVWIQTLTLADGTSLYPVGRDPAEVEAEARSAR